MRGIGHAGARAVLRQVRGARWLSMVVPIVLITGCSTQVAGTAGSIPSAAIAPSSADPVSSGGESTGPTTPQAPVTMTLTVTATTTPPGNGPTPAPPTASGPTASAAARPPTDLSGQVYGFVTAVDIGAGQITLDKVDWFTGGAAVQACAEDGIAYTDNNWCTGYYFRNVNPMLRVVAVSPQANITTLAGGATPVAGTLADVAAVVNSSTGSSYTYDLTVDNGVVTELHQMYHP